MEVTKVKSALNRVPGPTTKAGEGAMKPYARPDVKNVTTQRGGKRYSYCLLNNDNNEVDKEFPMFIAMADLCVTPTGFTDPSLRDAICSRVRLMCGEVSMAYTNKTTHLLAAHANTTKVELARERNLKVVSVEWIENIWNACQQNNPYVHASLPVFQSFDIPLFYNLKFVFSKRYDVDSKQFYECLLLTHGGSIGNMLKNAANYFYICQEPEAEEWYEYAQARDVPCVPLAWIIESINRKSIAKITEFEIRGRNFQGFGATFDMGAPYEGQQALPMPNYPEMDGNTTVACQQVSKMGRFDDDSILTEVDNYVPNGDETNSTTLVFEGNIDVTLDAGEIEEEKKYDLDSSYLDQTIVAEENGTKDSFVDSLAFSMAG